MRALALAIRTYVAATSTNARLARKNSERASVNSAQQSPGEQFIIPVTLGLGTGQKQSD